MKSFNSLVRGLLAFLVLVVCAGVSVGQTINNKGTWTNTGTTSVTNFNNHQGGTGGTIENSGTLTISNTLNNDNSGSVVNNNAGGTINLTGATGVYNNGAGATNNSTATSTIRLGNTLTLGAGVFDTQVGLVEYTKNDAQTIYSGVLNNTYGALTVKNGTTAVDKSLNGLVIVSGDVTADNARLRVNGHTLKIGGTGFTALNGGDLKADDANSTTDYTANAAQTIFPTTYTNLTLSGTSGTNTKSADGNLTINGTLEVSAFDELDVINGNTLAFGNGFTLNNLGNVKASGDVTFGTGPTINDAGTFTYYSSSVDQNIGVFAYKNLVFTGSTQRIFQSGLTSVSADYTVTGHTGTRDYRTNSSEFRYAGAIAQSVVADNYYDLSFSGNSTKTLGSGTAEARNVNITAGTFAVNGGDLNVGYGTTHGSLTNAVGATLTIASGSTVNVGQSGGTLFGSLTNNETLTNAGTLNLYGNGTATYALTNAGTLTNQATGVILVKNADLVNEANLSNAGTITVEE